MTRGELLDAMFRAMNQLDKVLLKYPPRVGIACPPIASRAESWRRDSFRQRAHAQAACCIDERGAQSNKKNPDNRPPSHTCVVSLRLMMRVLLEAGDAYGSLAAGDFLREELRLLKEILPYVEAAARLGGEPSPIAGFSDGAFNDLMGREAG